MDQTAPPSVNEKHAAEARVAGHFGELVQGRLGPGGPVALVTLPCPNLVTRARFVPGGAELTIAGGKSAKTRRAVQALISNHAPGTAGVLQLIRASAPGSGAGSSTADILGALRAIATANGTVLSPDEEARLCRDAEGAVDPLMYPGNVLFASRRAEVIETLPPLPAFSVAGGFAGPGRPTRADDQDFPDMTAAFDLLRAGCGAGDPRAIADAARLSAEANQARNPNPFWQEVCAIGQAHGALGPVVSHTGSAIGVILPSGVASDPIRADLREIGLERVLVFSTP